MSVVFKVLANDKISPTSAWVVTHTFCMTTLVWKYRSGKALLSFKRVHLNYAIDNSLAILKTGNSRPVLEVLCRPTTMNRYIITILWPYLKIQCINTGLFNILYFVIYTRIS